MSSAIETSRGPLSHSKQTVAEASPPPFRTSPTRQEPHAAAAASERATASAPGATRSAADAAGCPTRAASAGASAASRGAEREHRRRLEPLDGRLRGGGEGQGEADVAAVAGEGPRAAERVLGLDDRPGALRPTGAVRLAEARKVLPPRVERTVEEEVVRRLASQRLVVPRVEEPVDRRLGLDEGGGRLRHARLERAGLRKCLQGVGRHAPGSRVRPVRQRHDADAVLGQPAHPSGGQHEWPLDRVAPCGGPVRHDRRLHEAPARPAHRPILGAVARWVGGQEEGDPARQVGDSRVEPADGREGPVGERLLTDPALPVPPVAAGEAASRHRACLPRRGCQAERVAVTTASGGSLVELLEMDSALPAETDAMSQMTRSPP